ncbi:MAG: GTP cyclohydrolase FolE2 [Luteolibacter sp.]
MTDTQNESDHRGLAIDRVGIRGLRHPLQVRDAHADAATQATIATMALAVDLPAQFKGTHMSRFVEALNESGALLDLANPQALPARLLEILPATRAHVEWDFPWFVEKSAPATGRPGLLDYQIQFELELDTAGRHISRLTLAIPVATLCPCSKAISEYGAHNQRGLVTFVVQTREPVALAELIPLVEQSASCELYSMLKRPDEKVVTERAFDNPVFVEDLVRNIATRANADPRITGYRVEAENFESIHNHSAWAVIESPSPDHGA